MVVHACATQVWLLPKGDRCLPLSRSLATAPCAALGGLKSDGTSAEFQVIAPATAADASAVCPTGIMYHRGGSHRQLHSPERAEEHPDLKPMSSQVHVYHAHHHLDSLMSLISQEGNPLRKGCHNDACRSPCLASTHAPSLMCKGPSSQGTGTRILRPVHCQPAL